MTTRGRWYWAATIVLPIITLGAYLLWIWPRPRGTSILAESGPYFLSLMTGLPFAWVLSREHGRTRLVLLYLAVGFVLLWWYALAVLCGVRGVCL
jgi:hypothetical protein